MKALLGIYWAYCKISVALELQYRGASLIYQIAAVLGPLISLVVWSTVARTNGGQVSGYTGAHFAAYFIVLMLVLRATSTYVMWDFEYRIRNGTLSALLLRPAHPVHRDLVENAVHNLMMLAILLPAAALMALTFHPMLRLELWAVAAFLPALLLAFAIRFCAEWTLALAAFWVTRTSAVNQTYFVAMLFLSGQLTPLALLPAPLQVVAAVSPFRWMLAFPVEILLGQVTPGELIPGLVAQFAWTTICLGALAAVWRAGLRRYSAVGA
jgi:ABC-2 type transport system permease protein